MKVKVAEVRRWKEEMRLTYYVIGDAERGFGIEVILEDHGKQDRKRCPEITKCFAHATRFARELASGAVQPIHLEEIVRDASGFPSLCHYTEAGYRES